MSNASLWKSYPGENCCLLNACPGSLNFLRNPINLQFSPRGKRAKKCQQPLFQDSRRQQADAIADSAFLDSPRKSNAASSKRLVKSCRCIDGFRKMPGRLQRQPHQQIISRRKLASAAVLFHSYQRFIGQRFHRSA